ncbi:hypothetical protein [Paenibacillus sp. CCS19]|uniref:hypothetical protein n=1 Tax=Paenibacillus sp. CCS19 TaxID=3158387 RepID=UPI00295EC75A|nr:hypothetical protein [Paenibacillus cellulosilyticus]
MFEGSSKWIKRMSGGRFGFRFGGSDRWIDALVDAGRKTFVQKTAEGIVTELAQLPLDYDFNSSCYHQWNVRKFASSWIFSFNGRTVYRGMLSVSEASIGMVMHYCEAVFAGVDVTRHYETEFRSRDVVFHI